MAATLEIHFLTLKYTHCQFCQNYPKKVAKIKLILAKLAFATNYEVCFKETSWAVKKPQKGARSKQKAWLDFFRAFPKGTAGQISDHLLW